MKTLIGFIVILLFTDVFAAEILTLNLDIKTKTGIFTRGSASIVQTEFDQPFKVKREDIEAEFVATRSLKNKNHVIISGSVFDVDGGHRKLIASPKIITEFGKKASLSSSRDDRSIQISLTPTL